MILVFFVWTVSTVWSFPEFSRHGYANCTACHVSPSGGGLLNPYGRELSKEALSTWGLKGEQYFAYNTLKVPESVNLGAYVRLLQLHRESPSVIEGRTILMQADVEASLKVKKVTAVVAAGRQEKIERGEKIIQPLSRRHYLLWQLHDFTALRVGKFSRYFGLNTPYHTSYVQRDLGFGQDTETYNVELSHYWDNFSFFMTTIMGTFDDKTSYATEKGHTFSGQYKLANQKFGFTYFTGRDEFQERDLWGPWFILSYSKNLYLMSESFFQEKENKSNSQSSKGYVNTNRLNYEVIKGVIPFVTFEASHLDWTAETSKRQSYGAGIQWFPRPHWEFMATYQRDRFYIGEGYYSHLYWLMVNFYL